MQRENFISTAFALAFCAAGAAKADQFAIQAAAPMTGASEKLLTALHMDEIDHVEINGAHFMIVEARHPGYVDAYIFAQRIDANALYRLEADWTGAGLSTLPVEARVPFMQNAECEFCIS